jgi:hypothetical protein
MLQKYFKFTLKRFCGILKPIHMNTFLNIVSFAIGIIGLLYAIYENRRARKIEDLNRSEA